LFCPKCHAEFRPGFTRCDECDVELVDELPREPKRRVVAGLLRRLLPQASNDEAMPAQPGSPLARRPLLWFFALTGAAYVVSVGFAATHQGSFGFSGPVWLGRLHSVSWLVIAMVALGCCWAVSGPRDRPLRPVAQLSIAVAGTLLVMAARGLEIWVEWSDLRMTTIETSSPVGQEVRRLLGDLPSWLQALSVGLVLAGMVSSFPLVRQKVRALVVWRDAHIGRLAGLALLVPAACAASAAFAVLQVAANGSNLIQFRDASGWLAVGFVTTMLLNVPLVFAWYGFVAERLLARLSPLLSALVVGLAWFAPYQFGWWVVNARMGDWVPYNLSIALSIVGDIALAVPAVWFMCKARGSLLPTLLFLVAGMVGSGVWYFAVSETAWVTGAEVYYPALVLVAVLFTVLGRMWQRPKLHSPLPEFGEMLPLAESPR
jgi:hypothetical protein